MGDDTIGAELYISGVLIVYKSMEREFQTEQSIRIIVTSRISGVSIGQHYITYHTFSV